MLLLLLSIWDKDRFVKGNLSQRIKRKEA